MRKDFWIVLLLLGFVVGCSDSQGGGLDFDPDDIGGVGEGIDPGKGASACYPALADTELNVVTWNIEFLNSSNTDLNKVKSIVEGLDADIIAVQEINSISAFNTLANSLVKWQGYSVDIGGSLDLGFLVKTNAFTEIGPIGTDFESILRPAVTMTVTHASGIEVTLFNIHLKCCSDGRNQRLAASNTMKSRLDEAYSSDAVILLGDFNDDIVTSGSPFQNFIWDNENYKFVDMGIALGSSANFSYPSWPSHIDHIMVSDELFDKVGLVQTIRSESCVSSYSNDVSDHRPVLASFK